MTKESWQDFENRLRDKDFLVRFQRAIHDNRQPSMEDIRLVGDGLRMLEEGASFESIFRNPPKKGRKTLDENLDHIPHFVDMFILFFNHRVLGNSVDRSLEYAQSELENKGARVSHKTCERWYYKYGERIFTKLYIDPLHMQLDGMELTDDDELSPEELIEYDRGIDYLSKELQRMKDIKDRIFHRRKKSQK